jgi:hypothetical protein
MEQVSPEKTGKGDKGVKKRSNKKTISALDFILFFHFFLRIKPSLIIG